MTATMDRNPRSRAPPEPARAAVKPRDGSPAGAKESAAALRSRTRRRLVVALALVVVAHGSAFAAQFLVLLRIEASFREVENGETRLAARLDGSPPSGGEPRGEPPGSMEAASDAREDATSPSRRELLARTRAGARWAAALLVLAPLLGALALLGPVRRFVDSEKAAAIDGVVARLAHEMNNPLQVMLGYLSLHRDLADRHLAAQLALVERETLRCKRVMEGLVDVACARRRLPPRRRSFPPAR